MGDFACLSLPGSGTLEVVNCLFFVIFHLIFCDSDGEKETETMKNEIRDNGETTEVEIFLPFLSITSISFPLPFCLFPFSPHSSSVFILHSLLLSHFCGVSFCPISPIILSPYVGRWLYVFIPHITS